MTEEHGQHLIYKQIVEMLGLGFSQTEVGQSVGLSQERVSEIIGTEEYKEVEKEVIRESWEETKEQTEGWDAIEKAAQQGILENLMNGAEPDFCLKAAHLANRAVRRGRANGSGGVGGVVGYRDVGTVTLAINQNFLNNGDGQGDVKVLEGSKTKSIPAPKGLEKKQDVVNVFGELEALGMENGKVSNLLAPARVKELLGE